MNVATTKGRCLTYSAGMSEFVKTSNVSISEGTSVPPTASDQSLKRDFQSLGLEQSAGMPGSDGLSAPPDWKEAWPEVQEKLCARQHLLLALSFDGILSPTAIRPHEATLPP